MTNLDLGARRGAFVLALLGILAGCEDLAPSDAQRLEQLNRRYAGQFQFSTSESLYLRARARPGVAVDTARSEQLFRQFFLDGGKLRDTPFVYLNMYAPDGEFLDQMSFDSATSRIMHEHVEYH